MPTFGRAFCHQELPVVSVYSQRHNSKHSKKAYRMDNVRCHILLLVFALVAAVNSQSYPRFEFRGDVLVNNSFIHRGNIGEGHNDSLHCVTNNSQTVVAMEKVTGTM